MTWRLRSERGFALIEMLAAIVLINIGILAMLLALSSGVVTLRRSAQLSTASVVADKQIEQYRAMTYSSVYVDTTSLTSTDSTYRSDAAYSATQVSQTCSPLVSAVVPQPDDRRAGRTKLSRGHVRRLGDARGRPRGEAGNRRRAQGGNHGDARASALHVRPGLLERLCYGVDGVVALPVAESEVFGVVFGAAWPFPTATSASL